LRFALAQKKAGIALKRMRIKNEEHHKIELNVLNTLKK
jgi:hypothetical protein